VFGIGTVHSFFNLLCIASFTYHQIIQNTHTKGLSSSFELPIALVLHTHSILVTLLGTVQQQASSPITSRARQGYSVITGIMGNGPQ